MHGCEVNLTQGFNSILMNPKGNAYKCMFLLLHQECWAGVCDLAERSLRSLRVASAATKASPLVSCFHWEQFGCWSEPSSAAHCSASPVEGGKKGDTLATNAPRGNKELSLESFLSQHAQPSYQIEEIQSAKLLPFQVVACFATRVLWTNGPAEAMGFCAVAIPARSYP